jgi:hypothetical protein
MLSGLKLNKIVHNLLVYRSSVKVIARAFGTDQIDEKFFISPAQFDVLLTDISSLEIEAISRNHFKINDNEDVKEIPNFPVTGILFGEHDRILFPLIVQHKQKSVKMIFLYDTGCPYTYISENNLEKLGIVGDILSTMNLNVHGEKVKVHPSVNHFKEINLVGQGFFKSHRLVSMVDYVDMTVIITKK